MTVCRASRIFVIGVTRIPDQDGKSRFPPGCSAGCGDASKADTQAKPDSPARTSRVNPHPDHFRTSTKEYGRRRAKGLQFSANGAS